MKIIISLILIFFLNKGFSYELIRDPIFENYFKNLEINNNLPKHNVYLVNSDQLNAFVLDDSIYFTTEIIKNIESESVLKSIYFHEVGHIYHKHYNSKKIEIISNKKKVLLNNIFSLGVAIFTNNANIGIATDITLDQSLINKFSKHSIRYEIQADNFMIDIIKKNNVNTQDLISFFEKLPENDNFFRTHPTHDERIILLENYTHYKKKDNTKIFEWIKAKYHQNSNKSNFNDFFEKLNTGKINENYNLSIDQDLLNYEIYKSGIVDKEPNKINEIYLNLIKKNSNPFLKIEYFNFILNNNLVDSYYIIEKGKNIYDLQDEYFFYFLYGKFYNRINQLDLSNYYFCQFYNLIKEEKKSSFFCKKYDIKNIPLIDKSYALFK